MSIFELLNLILQGGVQAHNDGLINASVNYETGKVLVTNTIGPLTPRTRIVQLEPDQMISATKVTVTYQEVKHGIPQDPTSAVSDVTNAVEVSRLIGRIWRHLQGE